MKKHLYLFLLIFLFPKLHAQQASRYTQSADEFGLDNPAGLSFEEMRYRGTVLSGYFRNQWWTASSGYPRTQAFSWVDTRPEKYQYGAAFAADKIGETRSFGLMGRYAHSIAEGLKIGVSAMGGSQRVAVENLDQYDPDDPIALAAGEARWRLSVGAGAFYHVFDRNRIWNWFAGLSLRHTFSLNALPGDGEAPAESDLLAQGGLGRGSFWLGGRLRAGLNQPGALDLYLRKYFAKEQFFFSGIFTSDAKHHTAGVQLGMDRVLSAGGENGNHYLIVSMGFSKPLSSYVTGNNLVFDGRVSWAWERKP